MNVLSLLAGIGGLDLGLERAGMTVVGQVELDPFCRSVLERHWPDVPRHDDVRTAVAWWLGGTRPAVDVVCGGFPCQPVSVAGRRRAQADERWLWPAAWAVIRDLRPRFAIMENVPGLLARGMGDVLGDLSEIGYDAEWDCVPAAAVGAPHRRDRVFVVAYPAGNGRRFGPKEQPFGKHNPLGRCEQPAGYGHVGEVAHANGERLEGRGLPETGRLEQGTDVGRGSPRVFGRRVRPGGWWSVEPPVGRVAHGLPARMVRDELHALGNAVVPQVAEHIGRLVMEAA